MAGDGDLETKTEAQLNTTKLIEELEENFGVWGDPRSNLKPKRKGYKMLVRLAVLSEA